MMNSKLLDDIEKMILDLADKHPKADPNEVILMLVAHLREFINPKHLAATLAICLLQTQNLNESIEILKEISIRKEKLENDSSPLN